MQGASRGALTTARESLGDVLGGGAQPWDTGEGILAVARAVDGNVILRRALADPSRDGGARSGLASQVFGGKVEDAVLQVVAAVAGARWSSDSDLVTGLETLAVEAFVANAEREGRLSQVEDEVFRFGRIVSGDDDLRAALTDRRAPQDQKTGLVKRLLEGRSAPETLRLAAYSTDPVHARRLDHVLDDVLGVIARRQEQLTALVTAAAPLGDAERERLSRALTELYGRAVHTNVVVDPRVLGGLRIEVGDEVIDGTILSRLDAARRRLTS